MPRSRAPSLSQTAANRKKSGVAWQEERPRLDAAPALGLIPLPGMLPLPSLTPDALDGPPEPDLAIHGVWQQLQDEKARLKSVSDGMEKLVRSAVGGSLPSGERYTSVQASISKTLRRRGPSLMLTKAPILRCQLYPASHAAVEAAHASLTEHKGDTLAAGLAPGSLLAHTALQLAVGGGREGGRGEGVHARKAHERGAVVMGDEG
jgi:hypothetical protein